MSTRAGTPRGNERGLADRERGTREVKPAILDAMVVDLLDLEELGLAVAAFQTAALVVWAVAEALRGLAASASLGDRQWATRRQRRR